MKYIELVDLYEAIGATTKRFESAIENGCEGLILKKAVHRVIRQELEAGSG